MNELFREKLFSLLSELTLVTNEEMRNAYENFIKQVQRLNRPENDYDVIFRTLNFTRIEYESLQSFDLCE